MHTERMSKLYQQYRNIFNDEQMVDLFVTYCEENDANIYRIDYKGISLDQYSTYGIKETLKKVIDFYKNK